MTDGSYNLTNSLAPTCSETKLVLEDLQPGNGISKPGSWDDPTKHHLRVPAGYHHSNIKVMFKNTQKGHATTPAKV